jgi:hypothetical protein
MKPHLITYVSENSSFKCVRHWVTPQLRRLVASLSPRRYGFAPRSANVGFVVDKVALGRFSLQVLPCSPLTIIPLYHLGDGQWALYRPGSTETQSLNPSQQQGKVSFSCTIPPGKNKLKQLTRSLAITNISLLKEKKLSV